MGRPICIIPAKATSKRLPGKNLLPVAGRPMLQRVIENAIDSGLFERVCVTSEDISILALAFSWGASMVCRPLELAAEGVELEPVFEHAISKYPEQTEACLLLATGIFATPAVLRESFSQWNNENLMVSWYGGRDAGQFYWINVTNYLAQRREGKEILDQAFMTFPMPVAVDINTEEDLLRAEQLYKGVGP